MARLIRTKSDTLSLVLRFQYINEYEWEQVLVAERGVPHRPGMEEGEE